MLRIEATVQRSIDLFWQLNCADEAIVNAYNISYCLLSDDNHNECVGDTTYSELFDTGFDQHTHYQIRGLKIFKHYAVSIALMSATNHGLFAEKKIIRTIESGN